MLRRVERALRDQNPQLALDLLGDFERTMPGGKLVEERFAAAVMARCALGLGSPTTLLHDFLQRHPSSVYFARVSQACEVGNRSPGAPPVRGPRP